jgi:hypothetical protein
MDPVTVIALTLGVGWASGINLYAAILTLGVMHNMEMIALPPDLQIVANPLVLAAAGLMYFVEFFADKIPGVDSGWDALHTFIRIPAGAVLAAQAVGDVHPAAMLAAGLVGGAFAATSHAAKATTRLAINTSPEPFSNWTASVLEDVAVVAGLWAALHHPYVFLALLVVFVALVAWLLPKLIRGLAAMFRKIAGWFRGATPAVPPPPVPTPPPQVR